MRNALCREAGAGRWLEMGGGELLQQMLGESSAMSPNVVHGLANFAGLYELSDDQVLVGAAGGVGNKIKVAFGLNRHSTIGIDCVAGAVNDLACHGAKPLLFMDYIATGKIYPEKISVIMNGVMRGCHEAKLALIGGKTTEIPGFYKLDEYELAGFAMGVVSREKLIDGSAIRSGDVLVGLASNGVHTSGFSVIRKLFSIDAVALNIYVDSLGSNLGDELLRPTRIYASTVLSLTRRFTINGIANIVGGGMLRNVPRMLPNGLQARIFRDAWPIPPVFEIIRAANKTPMDDLFSVFNMGIGLVLAVPADCADAVVRCARELDERAFIIGDVVRNSEEGMVIVD